MGGGTVLIPVLTIFFKVEQHLAQAVNLVSFIPMSAVSLGIHLKNNLVRKDGILYIIVSAVFSAVAFSVIAFFVPQKILGKIFGGFLLALSVVVLVFGGKQNGEKR